MVLVKLQNKDYIITNAIQKRQMHSMMVNISLFNVAKKSLGFGRHNTHYDITLPQINTILHKDLQVSLKFTNP